MLKLPVPLPVIFQPSAKPKRVMLGFVDTLHVRANEVQKQVNLVLNNFAKEEVMVLDFEYMDRNSFTEADIRKLASEHSVMILKTPEVYDAQTNTKAFRLIAMSKEWGDKAKTFKDELSNLFKKAEVGLCRKCKCPFNVNSVEKCEGPRSAGLLIQFKEGTHERDPDNMLSHLVSDMKLLKEFL